VERKGHMAGGKWVMRREMDHADQREEVDG
jgi:hypothetical protein